MIGLLEEKEVLSFDENFEVEERKIGFLLDFATHAPSAGNLKEWEFVVVKEKERKKEIAKAAFKDKRVLEASVVIIICIDEEKLKLKYPEKEIYGEQDAFLAAAYLAFAAKFLDLDFLILRNFDKEKVSQTLELPQNLKPKVLVLIGKGKEFFPIQSLNFRLITHLEKFGKRESESLNQ